MLEVHNCSNTTTSTTTTTTTTTTSTTTSTTTTTAAPVFVAVLSTYGLSDETACSSTAFNSYFETGEWGLPGNYLYDTIAPSLILATPGWYRKVDTELSFEWDGTQWTGDIQECPDLNPLKTTEGGLTKTMEDDTDKTLE